MLDEMTLLRNHTSTLTKIYKIDMTCFIPKIPWQILKHFNWSFYLCSKFQIVTQYCWCDYFGLWQWLTGHFFSLSSRKSIKTRISSRSSFRSRSLCNYCGGRSGMFINTIWINAKAIFTWCSILHSCWILGLLYILQVFINYYYQLSLLLSKIQGTYIFSNYNQSSKG